MASKMVTDRQRLGREVLAAIDAHAGEIAAALAADLGQPAAGSGALQHSLRQRLEERLEALVRADEEHLSALADLAGPRRRRDEAAAELGRWLVRVRRLAEGIYGDGAAGLLGLDGRISQRSVVLLRQARRAVAQIADPARPRPPQLFASDAVDETEWLARLRPPIAALDRALGEVARAARRAESTLAAKQAALADYDIAFGRLARFLESLFTLAGFPSFAARLRPGGGRLRATLGTSLPDRFDHLRCSDRLVPCHERQAPLQRLGRDEPVEDVGDRREARSCQNDVRRQGREAVIVRFAKDLELGEEALQRQTLDPPPLGDHQAFGDDNGGNQGLRVALVDSRERLASGRTESPRSVEVPEDRVSVEDVLGHRPAEPRSPPSRSRPAARSRRSSSRASAIGSSPSAAGWPALNAPPARTIRRPSPPAARTITSAGPAGNPSGSSTVMR